MVLGGLWHGANWTFILWGVWHGGIMAIERALGAKGRDTVWPKRIALPLTFGMVVIGWVVFRAPDLGTAFDVYAGMFGLQGFGLRADILWEMQSSELVILLLGFAICFAPLVPATLPVWIKGANVQAAAMLMLFALATSRMAAQSYSPFLYFQF